MTDPPTTVSLLAPFLSIALAASNVPAQSADGDSLAILEDARAAQAGFERLRVQHLPWGWSIPRSPGDEIVGRFVLLDDGEERWVPPPEAEAVVRGRAQLLAALDRAAAELPGDGWIAGTRVRYLVEAGRPAEAIELAATCRAEAWWCAALAGYARHAAGDFVAAESAFDRALAAMPPAERERWLDLELLLDGGAARAYGDLGAGARLAFARRLWWLADPLWSVAGNDRRTEHFSRHVLDRIQEGARTPFDVRWGDDLREILLRYGWPAGWERVRRSSVSLAGSARPSVVGRDPPAERSFLPPYAAIADPAGIGPGDWSLDDKGARTTYAPGYAAERFIDLDHQLAVFRRGDSAVVVAGYDLSRDTLPAGAEVEAALIVGTDPDRAPGVARARTALPTGAISLETAWSPAVVSVEARVSQEGVSAGIAGRARYGLPLGEPIGRPAAWAASDLLLLDRPDPLPGSLAAAIPRARGSTRVSSGEQVGLYWEVYPPDGRVTEEVTRLPAEGSPRRAVFSLRLRDERGGFWRGLGEALGLVDRRGGEVALEWIETVPPGTVYPRALAVTLPDLPPGAYALDLEVRFDGSRPARASRSILVAE